MYKISSWLAVLPFLLSMGVSAEPVLGSPLSGLTASQMQEFIEGRETFTEEEDIDEGLGPILNGTSCGECHAQPTVGGSSPNVNVSRETLIGRVINGKFDPMVDAGGLVLQRRSIDRLVPECPPGEVAPKEAEFVSLRITTPLFGAGLIEAIPVSEILKRVDPLDRNRNGISGVVNLVNNPESGRAEVGRFGWKAQMPTLHLFSGLAYLNEMGVTSKTFPDDNKPQGKAIPDGCDQVNDPEDEDNDVQKFTNFMILLAPPPATENPAGMEVFSEIGCSGCHVPSMVTGNSQVVALSRKQVKLFSDLLVHDMGPGLADGIEQGTAKGNEWRTAPLWGLGARIFLMHDGRSMSIDSAVRRHGGEATKAIGRYKDLSAGDRGELLRFLEDL